jgi:hypothetical protein
MALGALALCVSGCPKPHPPSSSLRSTQELNLAWEVFDPNGLPHNPRWNFQRVGADGRMPLADPEKQCGGFPTTDDESRRRGNPQCTDQETGVDLPTGWHKPVCGAEFIADRRWGKLRGHVNWRPVTVSGYLTWNDVSGSYPLGDGDYTLSLVPADDNGTPSLRGLTVNNQVPGNDLYAYHIEYNGTETVAHFNHPWWTAHRERVESGEVPATSDPLPGQIPNGTFAIVTGLFGLDAEHRGYSELHPVYALSILVSCADTPDANGYFNDEWAVFIRTWGNEGFCADWNAYHLLDLPDAVYAFRILLPGVDPGSVKLGERTRFLANLPRTGASTHPGKGPFLVPDVQGVAVRFQLPESAGPLSRQNDPPRLHGLLHLQWKASRSALRACPRHAPVLTPAALVARDKTEADGEDVLRFIEQDQQERRARGLPAPAAEAMRAPVPLLDTVEITDRSAIPAPALPVDIPDCIVRVPETAGVEPEHRCRGAQARAEAALVQDVDEPPPVEICAAARQMELTRLAEPARRRLEALLNYCKRTQR